MSSIAGSGAPVSQPDATGHEPEPRPGTYARESDGAPVELLEALDRAGDWPLVARCKRCGRRIWLGHPRGKVWLHVPGEAPLPRPETARADA